MKAILLLLLLATPLAELEAATLRCGSALISTDDSTAEVLGKCGEPANRDFLGYREVVDAYGFRTRSPSRSGPTAHAMACTTSCVSRAIG